VALSGKISYLINGYEDEETFFVKRLSYGIAKIAAAFYPNKVIVRFSDFKSNEYKNLLGRRTLRAGRGEPDDRLAWRIALLQRSLQRSLRAGMQGHSPCT
jgi:pyruvate,water dikinase